MSRGDRALVKETGLQLLTSEQIVLRDIGSMIPTLEKATERRRDREVALTAATLGHRALGVC